MPGVKNNTSLLQSNDYLPSFRQSFYATSIATALQLYNRCKVIFVGVYSSRFISIEGLNSYEVENKLKPDSVIYRVEDINILVLVFHCWFVLLIK